MAFLCCCCPGGSSSDRHLELVDEDSGSAIALSARAAGTSVSITSSGSVLSGSGAALASTPIEQDAAYWEIKVLTDGGTVGVGVARELSAKELEKGLASGVTKGPENAKQRSWALLSGKVNLSQGDVIGVAFGQNDLPNLRFTLNDAPLEHLSVNRIRGLVYPAAYVDGGAEIELIFSGRDFAHTPPQTFSPLMAAQSIL